MKINQNPNFGVHNTSVRKPHWKVKYIAIHYVGATGDADDNIEYYNRPTTTEASADFYVGHSGDVWQYNPDPKARYCWAVGGEKQSKYGASLHKVVYNANSISVEMCVKSRGNTKIANHKDWYFTQETIDSTVELVKYLMKEYDVPADRVVRHFDVTGKLCPGVVGWNFPSGSEDSWNEFRKRIGYTETKKKKVDTVKVELPILKRGMEGEAVKSWQYLLVANGYSPKGIDGSFGPGCEAATKEYQRAHGLKVDGQVGPEVYATIWSI